jgi:hypothetical protein
MSSAVPNQVLVYQDTPNRVIIEEQAPTRIVVNTGVTGGNTRRHTHTQSLPSSEWIIDHTLGGKPQVSVVDTSDTCVVGEVSYEGTSRVVINFTAAFAGFAYLT